MSFSITDWVLIVGIFSSIVATIVSVRHETVARKKAQNDYNIAMQASIREDIATMRSVHAETIDHLRGRIEGLEHEIVGLKERLAENEKASKEAE
jgi:uncharacterized membrane protein